MTAAVLIAGALTGCTSHRVPGQRECLADDPRIWSKLETPPPSAEELRRLANANPVFPNASSGEEEWFASADQVILCRRVSDNGGAAGEWWKFVVGDDNPPRLVASDGWITTFHSIRKR